MPSWKVYFDGTLERTYLSGFPDRRWKNTEYSTIVYLPQRKLSFRTWPRNARYVELACPRRLEPTTAGRCRESGSRVWPTRMALQKSTRAQKRRGHDDGSSIHRKKYKLMTVCSRAGASTAHYQGWSWGHGRSQSVRQRHYRCWGPCRVVWSRRASIWSRTR